MKLGALNLQVTKLVTSGTLLCIATWMALHPWGAT